MKSRVLSLAALSICVALVAVPAIAGGVYDNGPINGNVDAWTINFGYIVSDTFTIGGTGQTINGLSFGVWLFPGDVVSSVDLSITSDEFGGTSYFSGTVYLTQTNISTNGFGYQIANETGSFADVNLAGGTYWLNLQNASTANGDPIYWDENSGPSQASESAIGTIPSESFTILGTCGVGNNSPGCGPPSTPEPSSVMLLGSGILGLASLLRFKIRP